VTLPGVAAMADRVVRGDVPRDHFLREALERARDLESRELHAFLSLAEEVNGRGDVQASRGTEGVEGSGRAEGTEGIGGAPDLLAGVPVALKDNICTRDLPTTCASRMLEGYVSPYESTVARRIRESGGAVIGKTNLDEFGMGSSTENSAFGPTRNPWNRNRVPGGSSGGSAAAVAAGIVPCALGSDTGGSVRQPAAFCGVVGIKPTYGRVSRYGLVAFASSLDQVGTIGRTVDDAARLLQAVAGHDPRDATSSPRPVPALVVERGEAADAGVEDLTVGLPEEYFARELDAGVRGCLEEVVALLRDGGARTVPVSLPHTGYAVPTYYVLAPAEASSNLARYDGVRFGRRPPGADSTRAVYEETRTRGFGTEVVRRILLGTFALSAGYHEAYYGRAQSARGLIARDFRRVWDDGVDVLFTPTTPTPAFGLGERTGDPLAMYLSDIYTVTANLAGIPALSIPVGTVDDLPVGGQLLAPSWEEARLVRVARYLERALPVGLAGSARPGTSGI
jgi:aspartyl-tRNA(Asn)/glutamyl-tRNA(Gln) amidotransferase subunit A